MPSREEDFRRLGGIAGGAVFILALPLLLLRVGPGAAMLVALAAGLAMGAAVYLGGTLVSLARTPAEPPPPPVAPAPALDETRRFGKEDVAAAGGLDQTVRIEPGSLDYVVPELSPEQILKEREGLDMGMLEQGIEADRQARENLFKGGVEEVKGKEGGP